MPQGVAFAGVTTRAEGVKVVGKLGFSGHPMIEHYKFVAARTRRMPKITIPAPSAIYGRTGRKAVSDKAYPEIEDFFADLGKAYAKAVRAFADAGCRYLQLDEVFIAMLCDADYQNKQKDCGDDPIRLANLYGDMINAAMSDIPADMTITMHLCRGNYRSTFMGTGGYEPVADVLFNKHQGARLFHGIRYRARRRVRAAALSAEGPHGRCWASSPRKTGELESKDDDQAPHRRGGKIRPA